MLNARAMARPVGWRRRDSTDDRRQRCEIAVDGAPQRLSIRAPTSAPRSRRERGPAPPRGVDTLASNGEDTRAHVALSPLPSDTDERAEHTEHDGNEAGPGRGCDDEHREQAKRVAVASDLQSGAEGVRSI